jgi:tetratricopeptide (TPR) repeat protein
VKGKLAMKMFDRNALVLMASLFLAAGAAVGENVDAVFTYYQDTVRAKETGVYEHDGTVFVNVRLPFNGNPRARRKKQGEAIMTGKAELRKWAYAQTAASRGKAKPLEGKAARLVELLDKMAPGWREPTWEITVPMREFPHRAESGWYVLGWAFKKSELVKAIPTAFSEEPGLKQAIAALPTVVRNNALGEKRKAFLSGIGLLDALGKDERPSGSARKELEKVNDRLADYLKDSGRAKRYGAIVARTQTPPEQVEWTDVAGATETNETILVEVATNLIADAVVTTNRATRALTADEIAAGTMYYKGNVTEETRVADAETVETRRTVTTVVTRKGVRRRTAKATRGNARFEALFLSGGTDVNFELPETARGKDVKRNGAKDAAALEMALRENPGDKQVWALLGMQLLEQDDVLGALVCFRAALKIDERFDRAAFGLAQAYGRLDSPELSFGALVWATGVASDADGRRNAEECWSK